MSTTLAETTEDVHYPDSDSEPMGETGIHVIATMALFATFKWFVFGGRPDVYVASDMFFYYERGNPRAVKAPDIMIIKNVAHAEERRSYKLWVEGRVPSVIFEVTSEETSQDDAVVKLELYAQLGVMEYYMFDPLAEYFDPPLRGYRLEGDRYEPIATEQDGSFLSRELGLKLLAMGFRVRVLDPTNGRMFPCGADPEAIPYHAKKALEDELEQERRNRKKEEKKTEAERKRAEAERKKAEAERKRTEAERKRADAERKKAEAERKRAEAEIKNSERLAEEVARLRALLGEPGEGRSDPGR